MYFIPKTSYGAYLESSERLRNQPYMAKLLKMFGDVVFIYYELFSKSRVELLKREVNTDDYLSLIPSSFEEELCKELYDVMHRNSKESVEKMIGLLVYDSSLSDKEREWMWS